MASLEAELAEEGLILLNARE